MSNNDETKGITVPQRPKPKPLNKKKPATSRWFLFEIGAFDFVATNL